MITESNSKLDKEEIIQELKKTKEDERDAKGLSQSQYEVLKKLFVKKLSVQEAK